MFQVTRVLCILVFVLSLWGCGREEPEVDFASQMYEACASKYSDADDCSVFQSDDVQIDKSETAGVLSCGACRFGQKLCCTCNPECTCEYVSC